MYKRVSWLIVCILGAVLPVAFAIAHAHYTTKFDSDTQKVLTSVESVLSDASLSKEQKQREIINLVAKKRTSGTTLFVYDTNGKMIFHPERPELNGRILTSYADPIVANAFKDLVKSANAYSESQVSYFWPDGTAGQLQNKVAYIRKIDNWNWVFAASQKQASIINWLYVFLSFFVLVGLMVFSRRTKRFDYSSRALR